MWRNWFSDKILNSLKFQKKEISHKVGLPPGSLVYIGNKSGGDVKIKVIDYSAEDFEEIECRESKDFLPFKDNPNNTWINLDGIHKVEFVEEIGKHFDLHKLTMEDVLNTNHRPKFEEFENHLFLTLKMLSLSEEEDVIGVEQVSFILGSGWLISFQEAHGDIYNNVRNRLRDPGTQLRKSGIDYLFYRLIDTTVDHYFLITEHLSNTIEALEEEVLNNPTNDSRWKMQHLKKDLIQLKKNILPLREAIGTLVRDDNRFIRKSTKKYFHDIYEHIIHLIDYLETQRDLLAGIMDLYLSGVSNKMNQVMKVLTIIATIFIPLTFIAGIYGMNFDNMPELHWKYGYYSIWVIMIVLVIGMLIYFKRKDWL